MSLAISDLAYKLPQTLRTDSKYQSGVIGRTTRVFPSTNDVYSPTTVSQIISKVPATGYVDMSSLMFRGTLQFTQGLKLSKSVHSLFRRITCRLAGGEILFDTDGYNVLQDALQDVSLSDAETLGSFGLTALTGSDDYRSRMCNGIQFAFQPNTGITRINKIIPLHLIGGLEFTFYLESTDVAFQRLDTSVTTYGFEITNFECVTDVVTVSAQVEQLYQSAYEQDRLVYPLTQWRMSPFQFNSPVEDLKIQTLSGSNRTLMIVPRLASKLLSVDANSFERTAQSLRYVQFQVGSNLLARYDATNGASQLYFEMQKALDFNESGTITPYNYHCALSGLTPDQQAAASTKFLIIQNLELSRTDESIMSGMANVPITVSLEFANYIDTISAYCFVLSDTALVVGRTQGARVKS